MQPRLQKTLTAIDGWLRRPSQLLQNFRFSGLLGSLVFIGLLFWFYNYMGVLERLHERPCSIHVSAQTQRASIAQNYANIDMNFFLPRINVYEHAMGVSGSEFPIVYYLAALCYKMFGFNDMYLRLITLLIFSAGIYFFFKLAREQLQSTLLAYLLLCALLCSTVLLYYAANVSPDTAALGFVLTAWYFFFKYLRSNSNRYLYGFAIAATLAGLVKVVAVMCFAVVFCLLFLQRVGFFRKVTHGNLVPRPKQVVLYCLGGMLAVVAWYVYCQLLTRIYGNSPSLMQTMAVTDGETLQQVWKYARNFLPDYYSYEGYVLLGSVTVGVLIAFRWANRLLLAITLSYFLGSLCYLYLFLYQFMNHDYYVVAMLPTVFFLFLTFFEMVSRCSRRYTLLINLVFVVVLFFNIKESLGYTRKRYNERFEAKVYFGGDYRAFYDLGPRLRALGIRWQDKVAVAFDNTISSSLYFMDQAGYTIGSDLPADGIRAVLSRQEVKYLLLTDSTRFNQVYPNNFAKHIVLYHRGLILYQLNKTP